MATCFCGCGQKVKRLPLGIRSINTRGRLVAERLAWARVVPEQDEMVVQLIAEGEQELYLIRAGIHGHLDIHQLDPDATTEWMSMMNLVDMTAVQNGGLTILDWLEQDESAELVAEDARGSESPWIRP